MLIPEEYLSTLTKIVEEARANGDIESELSDVDSIATVCNIQAALSLHGYEVSTGLAEEVYRMYSQNKWASWISSGCKSVEHAVLVLKEFCHDIQCGENHIGL